MWGFKVHFGMKKCLKSLFEGPQRNMVITRVIEVSIVLGKNACIFMKNTLIFLKDVCGVPKSILRWQYFKSLLKGPQKTI